MTRAATTKRVTAVDEAAARRTRSVDVSGLVERLHPIVIHADGNLVSGRRVGSGWFGSDSLQGVNTQSGDMIFVPETVNKTDAAARPEGRTRRPWQFGSGLVAMKMLGS